MNSLMFKTGSDTKEKRPETNLFQEVNKQFLITMIFCLHYFIFYLFIFILGHDIRAEG